MVEPGRWALRTRYNDLVNSQEATKRSDFLSEVAFLLQMSKNVLEGVADRALSTATATATVNGNRSVVHLTKHMRDIREAPPNGIWVPIVTPRVPVSVGDMYS